ncbi:uncharacterized protein PHALS_07079 [Plasmopara halstedii]|uniref:Uncharacterized protein n=1 Tax=Plasmopara halstedii TaxID=4781 RepID=A0A0P1B573_PLAHL|nr:uncharacterized protein PHALS_07079 [Plasmopara halstedii]CEG49309.1 hypothetical protein PHALS_07079 [Plasmopara halstedii]|eukprot:XP_024585678.1 hypothetical protein PHALS_07079 [Plasmopara halstedii]
MITLSGRQIQLWLGSLEFAFVETKECNPLSWFSGRLNVTRSSIFAFGVDRSELIPQSLGEIL